MEAKGAGRTPQDIIFEDIDDFNKVNFTQLAEKELKIANKQDKKLENEALFQKQLQKYQKTFRNYYYQSSILSDQKGDFFEDAMRDVHSSVKIKAPAKNILRLVNKILVQELAEVCFELMEQREGEVIDQELVEDAYRLLEKRRAKYNKFSRLFEGPG